MILSVIKETYVVAPPPKELKYNFSKKSIKHIDINGQEKQPILVNEKIFKNKLNNGFFVEAGAWDGESFSNTLFFELKKNWTGLLVEPNPDAFEMMTKKVRTKIDKQGGKLGIIYEYRDISNLAMTTFFK